MRPSDKYPIEVLSSMDNLEEEKEEEGEDEEVGNKESILKLFFMETQEEDKSN